MLSSRARAGACAAAALMAAFAAGACGSPILPGAPRVAKQGQEPVALPSTCESGIEPALAEAVGPLYHLTRRDAPEVAAPAGPSAPATLTCTMAFTDGAATLRAPGAPYTRAIGITYEVYGNDARAETALGAGEPVPGVADGSDAPPIGDESVSWLDTGGEHGACVQFRIGTAVVLVAVNGADYSASEEMDDSSSTYYGEVRAGAVAIALAVSRHLST